MKALRSDLVAARRQVALGQADDLVAAAEEGLVVALVEGIDRDGLRDLALTIRDRDTIRAVVLGAAPDGGGAALVAAVSPDSGLDAGELVAEAAKTIGGGGRSNPDLTVVGGRSPENLAEALEQAQNAVAVRIFQETQVARVNAIQRHADGHRRAAVPPGRGGFAPIPPLQRAFPSD